MGNTRSAQRILVVKSIRKQPEGRLRRKWEDTIRLDIKEVVRMKHVSNCMKSSGRFLFVLFNFHVLLPKSLLLT
jgi:hypothetical protein